MDYRTEQLILHFVTEEDLAEVARAWWSDHRPVSEEEAHQQHDDCEHYCVRNEYSHAARTFILVIQLQKTS